MQRAYGWIPGFPNFKDYKYKVVAPIPIPQVVDLRKQCPDVYNQGMIGSCTSQAIAAAVEFDQMKQGLKFFCPSRLFIYYNERMEEGTVGSDSGAMIADGFKAIKTYGVVDESVWPYDVSRFSEKPPDEAYSEARCNLIDKYENIPDGSLFLMKQCLAKGYPYVFGFTVYEGFESDEVRSTGILPMPDPSEKLLGGHAVLCVGFNELTRRFYVRNSWGKDWGQEGYFEMPYDYMGTMASDIWTINQV